MGSRELQRYFRAVVVTWFVCSLAASSARSEYFDSPVVVRKGSPVTLQAPEGSGLLTRLHLRANTPIGILRIRDRESAKIVRSIPLAQIEGRGLTSLSLAPAQTYDVFLASAPAEAEVQVFSLGFQRPSGESLAPSLALYPVSTSRDFLPIEIDHTVFLLVQGGEKWCSGVVVDKQKGLVATAGHCLLLSGAFSRTRRAGVGDCHDIEAFAGYVNDQLLSPTAVCQRAAWVYANDYDYALLRVSWVDQPPVADDASVGSLPEIMEKVYILQHPKGRPMHWCEGRRVDRYTRAALPNFVVFHDCDTLRGSSGAPVFNESGDLVGIHIGTAGVNLGTTVGDFESLFTKERLPRSVAVDIRTVLSLNSRL